MKALTVWQAGALLASGDRRQLQALLSSMRLESLCQHNLSLGVHHYPWCLQSTTRTGTGQLFLRFLKISLSVLLR